MTTVSRPRAEWAEWKDANQAFLTATVAVTLAHLTGEQVDPRRRERDRLRTEMPAPPAINAVVQGFGLSEFERDVLLLCAGVELDTAVARACANSYGDPSRQYATFSLAFSSLPGAHWSALSPSAPLRRWHLVEVVHPERPTSSPLRIDERVLHALAGVHYLDPRIDCLADPLPAPGQLPDGLRSAATALAAAWRRTSTGTAARYVRLHGRHRLDRRAVMATAAAGVEAQAVLLRAGDLPPTAPERELLARLCERESVLGGRCWLIELDDGAPEALAVTTAFARRLHAPAAVASDGAGPDDEAVLVEVPELSSGELRAVWADVVPDGSAEWVDRLAGQFAVGAADIAALAVPGMDGPDLWAECRSRARPALEGLAERVQARAGWDDLVLPPDRKRLLRETAEHVRHRLTVFDDWGFATQTNRGCGVSVLFLGPSGTGKTSAAEVLAGDLALDLYRVDLSQVVSKYIGETEKNLRRIFDAAESGGVVLLFDEADALFGKRSEVKDAHDRYANIEVSYLLQRMETYRGLAILTSNLKDAIDPAFLRRLRFIVQFPFPDAAGRAEIWRGIFPADVPTEGLDVDLLARLAVAGGTIRNIALLATFLAAGEDSPVRMEHCLAAARTEYGKLGKRLTDGEVAGWTR